MSEKTEKATPYKLKKEKERGKVSKSAELNFCILFLSFLGITTVFWLPSLQQLKTLMIHLLRLSGHFTFGIQPISHLQQFILEKLTELWLPFAFTGCLSLILSNVIQSGFVWSSTPLLPNFKRLNIVAGIKHLFSFNNLFESSKMTTKLGFAFLLLSINFYHEINTFLYFTEFTPQQASTQFIYLLWKFFLQLLLLLSVFAVLDKYYTRWKYGKENRMTKQEIKDEYRQREGDPKIKAKIKQLQRQIRQKTVALEQVKAADVVITNPTQLAIALKYQRETMPAPQVICKAQGELAKQVRFIARRHQIPLVEHKPFAQALFASVELNQWIGREHYSLAAMIFSEIYRAKTMSSTPLRVHT